MAALADKARDRDFGHECLSVADVARGENGDAIHIYIIYIYIYNIYIICIYNIYIHIYIYIKLEL